MAQCEESHTHIPVDGPLLRVAVGSAGVVHEATVVTLRSCVNDSGGGVILGFVWTLFGGWGLCGSCLGGWGLFKGWGLCGGQGV